MLNLNDPYIVSFFNLTIFLSLIIGIVVYKYIYPKKDINLLLILILISIIPVLSLFRPGTFEAGDLRPHTAQLLDFYSNLREGVLVPRWSANLCAGYGCPIFIIEYTLPYYLGSIFHLSGFSALTSLKLVLASSFIASGITMYFWAKDSFGKIPGFVAALLYLFAPYHLVTMHFRGSVGEVMAFVFIPLIFFFTKKLIESGKPLYFILLPLSVLSLILSHSSTTAIALPLSIGYGLVFWFYMEKRNLLSLLIYISSIIFGILISTFYWLPAVVEIRSTWLITLTTLQFSPFIDYIFSPYYFGFLFQGSDGRYTPIIGYLQLIFLISGIYLMIKNKTSDKHKPLLIYFILSGIALIFMMLSITKPIWAIIPILSSFLFVYRLLVPLAFVTAAIGAIVVLKIKSKHLIALICFLIIITTVLNWANRKMIPPLSNPFLTSDAVYAEYFEKGNPIYEKRIAERNNFQELFAEPRINNLEFINGSGSIILFERKQEKHTYLVSLSENSILKENTYYFPGWKVLVKGQEIPISYEFESEENFGKIVFSLKKGLHEISIIYSNTAIENVSKLISVLSILSFSALYIILFILNRPIDKFKK